MTTHIGDMLKVPIAIKTKETEWGNFIMYFDSLNLVNRKGIKITKGFLGMLLMPYVKKNGKERCYRGLYDLKANCERSTNPRAAFWSCVMNRKRK